MTDNGSPKGNLLKRDDALLLIIDMQDKLFRVMSKRERLMANVIKLVKFSRILKIPMVVTEQQKLGNTLYVIREDLPEYRPVTKLCFDCFGADGFRERLEETGRRSLIVLGIEAHICVTQTVIHALSDYTVHVVSDAVSSRSPHDCEVALQRMGHEGATVTSTEMVIYELLETAADPAFKETLKLIK